MVTMLLPYYHIVSDEWVPHVSPLYRFRNVGAFRRDLDWLLRRRTPMSLTEFLASTTAGARPKPNGFFLTFDDGFREIYDVVRPILKEKGVPAVFFLTSGAIDNKILCVHQRIALILDSLSRQSVALSSKVSGILVSRGLRVTDVPDAIRSLTHSEDLLVNEIAGICGVDVAGYLRSAAPYLTTPQIAALLADGFGIGSHSINHPLYSRIPLDEQLRQTKESMRFLTEQFPLPYRLFAFPHSDASVSEEFFAGIRMNGAVQATFGTSAPHLDSVPNSFQRFSMEKTSLPAPAIVALQSLRRIKQNLTGRSLIKRH